MLTLRDKALINCISALLEAKTQICYLSDLIDNGIMDSTQNTLDIIENAIKGAQELDPPVEVEVTPELDILSERLNNKD